MNSNMATTRLLDDYMREAIHGRNNWIDIKKQVGWQDNWTLVILPNRHSELVQCVIRMLPQIKQEKYMEKVVVLTEELHTVISKDIIQVQRNQQVIESIMRYYRLQQFASNIYVASDEMPYGCSSIIGVKGITIEDYVRYAIFTERGQLC